MRAAVVFFSAVAIVHCVPVTKDVSVLRSVFDNVMNCAESDVTLCLKEQALKATERLGTVRKLNLIDGVTIYNHGNKEARSLDILSEDPELRKKQVTEKLWENTSELLQNSEVEFSFGADDEESRALGDSEEGRGKKKGMKKKLKMLLPLAILAKAKAIALIVLALLVIAASLFKIAVLAKIAFLAKIITLVKSLLAKKQGGDDHGWAQQSHDDHGSHGWDSGSSGWSRSRNEANNLAYSAYRK